MKITIADFELLAQSLKKEAVSDISIEFSTGADSLKARFVIFGYEDASGSHNEIKLYNNGNHFPTKTSTFRLEKK